ncbi:MAG: putative solute-binding protein [Cognaticolwellia sp.]|jgi:predicted solute-binding protein
MSTENRPSDSSPIRVAAVGYTNAWPLLTRLDRIRYQVTERHPTQVAELLRTGQADVGLVPVAAMLSDGDYKVIPGWCIGCEGPVHSVLLVAETPPEEWTAVALDGVSRTSVALSKLLLTEGPLSKRVPKGLKVFDCEPGKGVEHARGTVAGLVIGDAARSLPERLKTRMDLGELWWEWTKLPFVFAVWAGRPDLPHDAVQGLRLAAAEGMGLRQHLPEPDRSYVTESIRYELDDRALMGLRRFAALGAKAGVLGRDTPRGKVAEFQLYGPASALLPRPDVDGLLAACAGGEPADLDVATTLHEQAPLTDLALAASLRSSALFSNTQTAYCLGGKVSVEQDPTAVLSELMDLDQAGASMAELTGSLSLEKWTELLIFVREHVSLQLSGLSPAQVHKLGPATQVIAALQSAGLSAIAPGRGLLLDEIARRRQGAELSAAQERVVLRAALDAGMMPTIRVVFGHMDTLAQRLRGLLAVRELEPVGVCVTTFPIVDVGWHDNTAADQQRLSALARLILPKAKLVADLQVHGPSPAQVMLHSGVDDFGVVWRTQDGESPDWDPTLALTELHLREAGRDPVRRDLHFKPAGGALTKPAWSADKRARA